MKRLIREQLVDLSNPNHAAEQFFFDELNADAMKALDEIINVQFHIIALSRKQGRKREPQILIYLDDVSDNPKFTRNNALLNKLYTRGRHARITTVTSVHRQRTILPPVVRAQLTGILYFRQRNSLELLSFLEEYSAMLPSKDDMERIYRIATQEPYSFLFVNLKAQDVNDMFFVGFRQRIRINPA